MLDERLTFHNHLDAIKKKISQRLYLLKKVRWVLNYNDALLLYKRSKLPYFDLGNIFYVSCDAVRLRSLQTLQNKGLRIILGKKQWTDTETAHVKCKLLKIHLRQKLSLLKYSHVRSFNPNNLSRHLQRSLRSQRKLLLHNNWPRNTKYERSYIFRASRLWNHLPEEYKRNRDIDKFKLRATKEMLLGNLNFPE